MRHARSDYDAIQDPRGVIPLDEPVFLLRAQDVTAPAIVRAWAVAAVRAGARPDIVAAAYGQANAMERWQNAHGSQVPDLPREGR